MGGLFILCHYMRIPNGVGTLARCARQLGFGIVRVPLESFLYQGTIRPRGWTGMELGILFLKNKKNKMKVKMKKETRCNNSNNKSLSRPSK